MLAGGREMTQLANTFAEQSPGEPFVVVGSSGFLEVAMNQGSAARTLGVASGAPVDLTIY
jgi:S-adenosylmethionine hydrolase